VLRRMAESWGCVFAPRIESEEGEIDAVIVCKGHVAVVEITSSSLRDAEGTSTDWQRLRTGLQRTFVENATGKKGPYKVHRVYPVMVTADRRTRTPGVLRFLQKQFSSLLTGDEAKSVAGLAVLHLEDVELLDEMVRTRTDLGGTPRGVLKVLRRWDVDRGEAPSWWQFIEVVYGDVPANTEVENAAENWRASLPGVFRAETNKT
jgi:hypothetical protein